MSAEPLRRDDGQSAGESEKETEDQEHDRTGRSADRGQRLVSEGASDDNGIGHIVELLKHISGEKWKSEPQDQLCGVSHRHIFDHADTRRLLSSFCSSRRTVSQTPSCSLSASVICAAISLRPGCALAIA